MSQLAEKYSVRPNDIYNWKKKLFESAADIFSVKPTNGAPNSIAEKKLILLEEKLKKREEAIAYLVNENILIKKNISGEI